MRAARLGGINQLDQSCTEPSNPRQLFERSERSKKKEEKRRKSMHSSTQEGCLYVFEPDCRVLELCSTVGDRTGVSALMSMLIKRECQ